MSSCSKKENRVNDDNDYPVVYAKLIDVAFDDSTMFPTDIMLISDSVLAVHEPKKKVGFMMAYNTHTQQLISEFGVIGDGPEDFINPRILNDLATANSFFIGDTKKIVRFMSDSISNEDYRGLKTMSIPSDMMFYNYILINNDSIIAYSQTGEHPISLLSGSGRTLSYIDYFPNTGWSGGTAYTRNMTVFANCMTSNSENIAIAYRNWNILSIITPNGIVRKEVAFPEWDYNLTKMHPDASKGDIAIDNDAKIFFTKVKSDSEYIFALGWATTKDKLRDGEACSFVYVLDWDGNIVRKIQFDRSVSNFCIKSGIVPYVTAMGDDGEIHVYGCEII